MVRVIPVNLPYNIKTLWFDPGDIDIHVNDDVVVSTARGTEIGRAAGDIFEVEQEVCDALKSPLKPVLRIASEEDLERAREMERKGKEAMPVFKQLARENNEDMHPVSVEYLLDGDKAIFYFEAEERIDFRELVRKLASHFHVRVDMRQIGVRDEARIVGGIGHCGQIVCCKKMGGEFKPVSIRMAKDQDLSLNPQKISGLCGRLMCCLRYEDEAYKEFKSRSPKAGSTVYTPDGEGKVESLDIPREEVKVKVNDEKPINVPIEYFDPPREGKRPNTISEEGWERAHEASATSLIATSDIFSTSQFTGRDKLGSASAIHHERSGASVDPLAKKTTSKSNRAKSKSNQQDNNVHRKQVKRRSTTILGSGKSDRSDKADEPKSKTTSVKPVSSKSGSSKSSNQTIHKLRPGHKSSGLAHDDAQSSSNGSNTSNSSSKNKKRNNRQKQNQNQSNNQGKQQKSQNDSDQDGQQKKSSGKRRFRRRRSGSNGSNAGGNNGNNNNANNNNANKSKNDSN